MAGISNKLRDQYRQALETYTGLTAEDVTLVDVIALGRQALSEGHGLVELVSLHQSLLSSLIAGAPSRAEVDAVLTKSGEFLSEVVAPFEMTHRGWHDVVARLHQLNETLEQQVIERTEALRYSERRFQDIAEVSGDWMWETDDEHRFATVFGERADALSIRGDSLIGRTRWEGAQADPATDEVWARHRADLDARRPFHQFRYEVQSEEGARRFVSASGKPVFDQGGNFLGYRGTATDETATVEARRQAEAAEAALRRVFETSQDLILVTDRNGTFIRVSPSAMTILGYSPEEMVGRSGAEFLCSEDLDSTRNEMRTARRASTTQSFECRYVHKRGHLVTLWWKGVWSASEQQFFFFGRDITERKAAERRLRDSEEQLRRAQHLAQMGSVVRNLRTDEAEWSDESYRLFGVSRETFAPSTENFLQLVHPDDRAIVRAMRDQIRQGICPPPYEYRIIRPDGAVRQIYRQNELIPDETGEPLYFAGTIQDVTERRNTERQLRQAQKMEAIGNLTGGMAHDFNNLLGVIIGNLDLTRERTANDAELHEIVGEALEAAWHGADLTRRLLAFARRQPLKPARVDVNELVADTVRLLRRMLGEDIEISLDLAEAVWPVTADPAQLEACLANLATNARDAMPEGGRLIITTADRRLDADYAAAHADVAEGDFVMIEVSDTGIGMSAEVMGQIFEPFFTTKEAGKGTGLGLSMVFGFLRQSAGHVNVYSEPGAGTTFRLYLPRMVTEALPRDVLETPAVERASGETVLVVEDNPAVRRVVLRQLRDLGYHVLEADRAAAAIEILQHQPADLLLTDVVMPGGLDGIALARIAAERWPALKIVLTSGFPQARIDGNGEILGNLQLLSKPYRRSDLAAALRAALNR